MGWTVIRFWGNDIKKNGKECVKVIEEAFLDLKMEEICLKEEQKYRFSLVNIRRIINVYEKGIQNGTARFVKNINEKHKY